MSYGYRPTPVLNTMPPPHPVLTVRGGAMLGVGLGSLYPGYYNENRKMKVGQPWITRSGAMGRMLGDDPTDIPDVSNLPELDPPITAMPDPIIPYMPSYPNVPDAPIIASSGSPIPSNLSNLSVPLPGGGATYGPAAPSGAYSTPGGTVVPAPSLFAQIGTSIASLFSPKTATPVGYSQLPTAAQPSWFTQATLVGGVPNWVLLAGAGGLLVATAGMARRRR